MNRIYRVVFNHTLGVWQAVSEVGKGRKKSKTHKSVQEPGLLGILSRLSGQAVLGSLLLVSTQVMANSLPTGGQVVTGNAAISQNGAVMDITQTTDKTAINWQSFNIGQGNTVNFHQPSASSVALNRVIGSDVSSIQGAINANGQVFLINPNGILFSPTAQVNVGGLVASTLDISTEDFLNGNYSFEGASSNAIINQGNITAANGGYIAMIAAKIENTGTITANAGDVLMGAGSKVTLDMGGPVKIQVEQKAIDALITNGGAIKADGGYIYLTAQAAGDLASTVINNTGIIQAQTLETGENGEIYLMGDMDNDQIQVAGTLDASAPVNGNGGFIETSAAKVDIQPGLQVTTKAENGQTGEWLIDPNDYTIAASGGDITGAQLGTNLASTNVTIQSVDGATSGNGDIFVNDEVTWTSGNTLTLSAIRNIEINSSIDASGGSGGKLVLEYGQGAVAASNTATYTINAPVSLNSGQNFSTKLGSNGTVIDYTVVTDRTGLEGMAAGLGGSYALGGDIDLSGSGWTPVGNSSTKFTGQFDGLGNRISNLTINSPHDFVGLFGIVASSSTVRNVGMENVSITTPGSNNVGGLAGINEGTVINSYMSGSVSGLNYVGGLVGWNLSGKVSNSFTTGTVEGEQNVGGLVGSSNNGTVENSYATGTVEGAQKVGGLVGSATNTQISDAYATGNVVATVDAASSIGGLVGVLNNSRIEQSYATGSVTTGFRPFDVGGLVGYALNQSVISQSYADTSVTVGNAQSDWMSGEIGGLVGYLNNSRIEESYAVGSVTTGDYLFSVGGLVGYVYLPNTDAITNSYANVSVTTGEGVFDVGGLVGLIEDAGVTNSYSIGAVSAGAGSTDVGGLFGNSSNTDVTSSFWDTETSGQETSAGGTGKTTAQMYDTANYAGWDMASWSLFEGRGAVVEGYEVGEGLPYLTNVTREQDRVGEVSTLFAGGWGGQTAAQQTGADGTAYSIISAEQLQNINLVVTKGYDFKLDNNIDLSGISSWNPIGDENYEFTGTFDGQNHTVNHLTINDSGLEDAGLFGVVGASSTIQDVGIVDTSITASEYVGGLAGRSFGTVKNSYATGSVTGTENVGGLIGGTAGTVESSYATASVTGTENVGGLIGISQEDTIQQSYAAGNVTGSMSIGGLVGYAMNTQISDAYATGNVVATDSNGDGTGYSDAGGLVGSFSGTISGSRANGSVTSSGRNTGGLVGYLMSVGVINTSYATGNVTIQTGTQGQAGGLVGSVQAGAAGNITNAYATGDVSANNSTSNGVGGLIGLIRSNGSNFTVTNTYSTGLVTTTGTTDVGGLIGNANGATVNGSFWDTETSGQETSAGGTGKTTAQMYGTANYAGWDMASWSLFEGRGAVVEGYEVGEGLPYLTNVTREQDRVGEVSTLFAGGWGGQTAAQQTGADGSAYTITTAEQLQNINLVASDGFDYKLSNYIDLTAITNWTPIGNDTTKFTGNFDGLGNTISNLGVTGGNYLGLFGYTLGANIENLTLDGVNIVSTGGWLGGLAGRADNTSIRNVSVTGISEISSTLTGDVRAGGLVGLLLGNSSLETVSSSATVTAADGNRVGGLVGESVNNSGTVNVSQATATGVTTGKERVGGLIGYANVGTNISNSSATGDVYGLTSVGGLVGFLNRSTILNSTASGDVIGRLVDNGSSGFVTVSKLGGLVGSTSFDAARSSIEDSHATGAVRLEQANPDANLINGFGTFGGLVGEAAYTDISDSTASGTVSAIKSSGGLVGQLLAESTITASQASGAVIQLVSSTSKNRIGGLVGYVGADGVIDQSSASGEIQLQSGAYEVGGLVGRADNGVQISQSHATGNIIGGANSSDIGGLAGDLNSAQVSGSYAVNTITLSENARSVGGLVGIGTGSSVITQSYANTGITTTNAGTYIGGLVGDFSGNEISESYATGTVAVSDNALQIGGLAGYASSASITNAYSTAALTVGDTASNIGGLVGQLSTNTVANAYATGAIAVGVNSTQVGGLIGTNGDATGANVTNSYWDTTTSGKITSAGGTGKTSAELQSLATYGSAGWSIDDQGGSANVWRIYEGYTNPLLRTFMTALTVSSLKDGKTYDAQTVTDVNDVAVLAGTYDNQHIFTVGDVVGKKDVGTYSFNIYSDQMGYDLIGTRTNNFVITKADLIVTGGSAANKVYDGTTVATVTGGVVNALLNDEVVLSDANATFADKNVGDGKAVTTAYTISGADAGNYNLIQQAGLTADITPATQVNTAVSDVQNSVSNPIQPPVVPAPTPLTLTLGDAGSTQMIGGLQVVEVTVEPGQAGGAYGGMLAGGLGNGAGNASGMQTVFVVNGGIRMPNASLNTEE